MERGGWRGALLAALALAAGCGVAEGPEDRTGAAKGAAIDPGSDPADDEEAPPPGPDPRTIFAPLSTVAVPQPVGGDIVDQAAAVRLGKALFWDTQTGSDGKVACATCHYLAGADARRRNTISPGVDGVFSSGGVDGPGQLWNGLSLSGDDRVGSAGIATGTFVGLGSGTEEICTPDPVSPFFEERSVTARNAPSVIGAVFNRQNFWDGSASDRFNGLDSFGTGSNSGSAIGAPIGNASLASQAVSPPGNRLEMACSGRPFNGPGSLATKLLDRRPLAFQLVDRRDSVLGNLSAWPNDGLTCGCNPCTYRDLVREAFGDEVAHDAEARFSRIFGQALQAYQATLIPDRTPFDRWLGGDDGALTDQQVAGLQVFVGKGNCAACHVGPELTDASVRHYAEAGPLNADGGDQGYHNIGLRPTDEDLGRGGVGPKGFSYSESGSPLDRGAFKTPGLRNVKLTAPYFHNGARATLREVISFYDRGGDFGNPELSSQMQMIGFEGDETNALLDFLENGLTDPRVEREQAPFDHPSLTLPDGEEIPAVGAEGR